MKRSTFKLLFYINRNKVKSDGTTAVLCRISIDGKSSTLTTGIYCRPDNWNAKKGIIKTERDNYRLMEFRGRMEQTYEYLLKELGVVSSELLKNTITGINSVPVHLLKAGEVERERLRIRSLEINSTSSYRQSKTTQSNLKDYIYSRGMEDIAFSDITEEFGESFKIFLKTNLGYKSGHINHCLCWLNRLIYIAVDQEILRANPIEEVSYEKKEAPKLRHINKSELKRIMETPMHEPMLELARRVFIFSCFTALAYVDTYHLYPHHIGKTAEGRLYIRKQRVKTNVEAFIPLHPVAEQILLLYNTIDNSKPVFPLPKRDVLWFEIKQIGVSVGIKEDLSCHMSRHSCGTLMLSSGLSIESISKMMGHTNISSTQIYAQVTDTKISEDMDKLIARRKKSDSVTDENQDKTTGM
jgi:site-specific recombinase XerD